MTTDTPTAVAPAAVAVMLADALADLPRPRSAEIVWDNRVRIHVASQADAHLWRAWWGKSYVRDWALRVHRDGGWWHHHQVAAYLGWTLELIWLTRDTSEHADELVGAVSVDG